MATRINRRTFLGAMPVLAAAAPPPAKGPRIWDLHCHIAQVSGRTLQERVGTMVKFADRMGIERFTIYMGDPHHYDPTPEQMRFENQQVLEAIQGHQDRVFAFVYLNPKYVKESLEELDQHVRDGPMVGVKLWVAIRCNAPQLDPIIERAAAYKAVIFQHTWIKTMGNGPSESTPMDLVELARRHPSVPLICGHTGGNWELALRVIRTTPTLFADLAGSDPTAGMTEMAVRELGAKRVLYGSDPNFRSFASQLGKVAGANISDEAKRLIYGENLRNMMLPLLTAKGIKA